MSDAAEGTTPAIGGATRRTGRPLLAALIGGLAIAAAMPPWGWWPLVFVGIALLDRAIADAPTRARMGRAWLAAMAWLAPATFWMVDLSVPGYIGAAAWFSGYFALAAAATPPGRGRRVVLPGAIALAELARWSWPFGGVPLAHLAMTQVTTPLASVARLGGSLLVVVAVVALGQALAAVIAGDRRDAAIGAGLVVGLVLVASAHPRAAVVDDDVAVALVQGGGPQRTRASSEQQPVVLARHVEASRDLVGPDDAPIDLIIWPENVVNPGRYLTQADARALVEAVAADNDATVLAGWFYGVSDENTVNYQSTITAAGDEIDRYDKVRLVPFGEYVPGRALVERFTDAIPPRDALVGEAEPVLDTPVGPVGVAISWEGFFESRSRHAVREGAQLLTNPTNGSSFWLTQVQTQQVASNRLRAIENDRWVLQVAPTGFSAVIDPDGALLQRTGTGERSVLRAAVEMRDGRTLASRVGFVPVVVYGLAAIGAGLARTVRPRLARRP